MGQQVVSKEPPPSAPRWLVMPVPGSRVTHRLNDVTGEWVPVERWVHQIHREDWDWFEAHWADMDAWDYRFRIEMGRAA